MVQVKVGRWESGRLFTLNFWGSIVYVENVVGAELVDKREDRDWDGANTIVQFTLGSRSKTSFAFTLKPPYTKKPQVICHEMWPPPPPPAHSPYLPPPPSPTPSPPPPPQRVVGDECDLGAIAVMHGYMPGSADVKVQIVDPAKQRIIIDVVAEDLVVSDVTDEVILGGQTQDHEVQVLEFVVGKERNSFSFHLKFLQDARLDSMYCRIDTTPLVSPPPPGDAAAYEEPSYSYESVMASVAEASAVSETQTTFTTPSSSNKGGVIQGQMKTVNPGVSWQSLALGAALLFVAYTKRDKYPYLYRQFAKASQPLKGRELVKTKEPIESDDERNAKLPAKLRRGDRQNERGNDGQSERGDSSAHDYHSTHDDPSEHDRSDSSERPHDRDHCEDWSDHDHEEDQGSDRDVYKGKSNAMGRSRSTSPSCRSDRSDDEAPKLRPRPREARGFSGSDSDESEATSSTAFSKRAAKPTRMQKDKSSDRKRASQGGNLTAMVSALGKNVSVSIPRDRIEELIDLKEAIADAFAAKVDDGFFPKAWREGKFDLMAIQYVTIEDELVDVVQSTDIHVVFAARLLHVNLVDAKPFASVLGHTSGRLRPMDMDD